ncbi:ATP synthase mitochondrial F1 complex assembly factor 1 isoform X2 [Sagmatias obliquidens]|uniref:ATP synthase mitochondrial F1 complex assembly factor 1 isoform X2 n=1 Tax=Sagmatias obliquidens TaxID=3371155 RepID=UPI000F4440CD|nr:ATP synthase mitochondrial F1 complex assembly factor 1 isoform X2 [Lagenorhynchus obliquidens]XP_026964463.1 ATP synthase mitochondrial F1 complex assembly factor 1 isoform X2 [Lagenorhynchus obliquidens]
MERARGPRAEADVPGEEEEEEEEEAGAAMAAVVAAAGGAGPAVLQVAGLYRGLCAVRSRALGLGLVSPAQLRVFPVRRGSGRPAGGVESSGVGKEIEANPFYDRYRDKIQQLRRSDPTAFESRLEKCSEFRKQPVGHSKQGDFIKCVEQKTDTLGKQRMSRGFTKDKTLSSIFNIEMVKDKTAEEIKQIWQQYFAAKDTVYAVIPKEKFDLIWNRAQSCPTFLCALPRREGYEFFVGQWTGTELHFTALINIQTRGEAAASQLILYHYPELKEEKGIVLMTAEMDSTFLNVAEAQCIANQVQLFYATDRKETYGLVETFNFRPNEFKYMSVIAELEQSGLGAELKCSQNQDKT